MLEKLTCPALLPLVMYQAEAGACRERVEVASLIQGKEASPTQRKEACHLEAKEACPIQAEGIYRFILGEEACLANWITNTEGWYHVY